MERPSFPPRHISDSERTIVVELRDEISTIVARDFIVCPESEVVAIRDLNGKNKIILNADQWDSVYYQGEGLVKSRIQKE